MITTSVNDMSPEVDVVSSTLGPDTAPGADTGAQISAFEQILQRFEQNTLTQRDKGTNFEDLVCAVLSSAQPWCDQFTKVQTYAEWAKEYPQLSGDDARDTGIDLVATNRVPDYASAGIPAASNDGLAQNAGISAQVRIENRGGGRDFFRK